jgi:hypothetical protein
LPWDGYNILKARLLCQFGGSITPHKMPKLKLKVEDCKTLSLSPSLLSICIVVYCPFHFLPTLDLVIEAVFSQFYGDFGAANLPRIDCKKSAHSPWSKKCVWRQPVPPRRPKDAILVEDPLLQARRSATRSLRRN